MKEKEEKKNLEELFKDTKIQQIEVEDLIFRPRNHRLIRF